MIDIERYSFKGPYTYTDQLEDRSGVYVILDKRRDGEYYVIDVGESARVKTRVESHDRERCWTINQQGSLAVAVLYTQSLKRRLIEQEIRAQYTPVCGIR